MASVLQVATIKDSGGNANAIEIANSSANVTINNLTSSTGFPAGHVLQVKNTLMGDLLTFTPTSQTWTDIAGLSVQITPSSSSNKIFVSASVHGVTLQNVVGFLATYRDSTAVGIGNASGSKTRISGAIKETTSYDIQCSNWSFLDSPATTSQLTYKVRVYSNGTVYINRPTTSADNWSVGITVCSITVMEIKV